MTRHIDVGMKEINLTKPQARKIAHEMLRLGYHSPTICEDIEHSELFVRGLDRACCERSYSSWAAWRADLNAQMAQEIKANQQRTQSSYPALPRKFVN